MSTTQQTDNLLQGDTVSQYLLHAPREIAFVLRQLAAKRSLVTGLFGNSQEFLLTSVLRVAEDNESVLFDLGRDLQVVDRAIASGRLLCDTQLDKIKVQFQIDHLVLTDYENLPALRAPLPGVLLRLQRREYYRLVVPFTEDVFCAIPLESGRSINARVIDISGGGLAMMISPANSPFAPGVNFRNCSLTLPGTLSPIKFDLEVRNLFRIAQRDGREMVRAGCQFLNMPIPIANQIQRYILRAEQERANRGI